MNITELQLLAASLTSPANHASHYRISLKRRRKGTLNAAPAVWHSAGKLTSSTPPRPSTCLDSSDDAVAPAPGSLSWRLSLRLTLWRKPEPARPGTTLCASLRRLHGRSYNGDGLTNGQDGFECGAGVYGAERTHYQHQLGFAIISTHELNLPPGPPLRLHLGPKALLQRNNKLRVTQADPRPFPLAAQAMVAPTAALRLRRARPELILLPPTARRHQFARHVHSRHGIRELYTPLHPPSGHAWSLPPRGHGLDVHVCLHRGRRRDPHAQGGDLLSKYHKREPAVRPGGLLRLQVRRGDRYPCRFGDHQHGPRHRRLGWLDDIHIYISRERLFSGM